MSHPKRRWLILCAKLYRVCPILSAPITKKAVAKDRYKKKVPQTNSLESPGMSDVTALDSHKGTYLLVDVELLVSLKGCCTIHPGFGKGQSRQACSIFRGHAGRRKWGRERVTSSELRVEEVGETSTGGGEGGGGTDVSQDRIRNGMIVRWHAFDASPTVQQVGVLRCERD